MVTAHPHPRAPQQRGLAPRAARKEGGTSQARGHTSAALVAIATGDVAKCAVSKQQRVLSGTPYSSNSPANDSGLDQRGILGCPRFQSSDAQKEKAARVLGSLAPEKGSPCRQPVPLPQHKPKAGAGSRKLGKDREVRRPHSGAVITGTCPSRPRLPLSLSHFFPCWKVPVP